MNLIFLNQNILVTSGVQVECPGRSPVIPSTPNLAINTGKDLSRGEDIRLRA